MIDYCQAKKLIEWMPFPNGGRPLLQVGPSDDQERPFKVVLYDAKRKRVVAAKGPTQEGALRHALGLWIGPKPGLGLEGGELEVLAARIARLTN